MKRKLVNFEVFDRIEKDSLSYKEKELVEAAQALSGVLDAGNLTYRLFDEGRVVYDTDHGTHIHASFSINENTILFEDITELVVDTESQRKKLRECVSKMVEAVIDGNKTEADTQFENYMTHYVQARKAGVSLTESDDKVVRFDSRQGKIVTWGHGGEKAKGGFAAGKSHKQKSSRHKRDKHKEKATRRNNELSGVHKKIKLLKTGTSEKKTLKEWHNLCNNVNQFVEFVENGYQTSNAEVRTNDSGDVTAVKIPTSHKRNEGKILTMQYKTMKTDVKVLREAARTLSFNESFIKAVSKIKRLNNMSHEQELEESINDLVSHHSNVLYLTQDELAKIIGKALDNGSQVNFDDNTCQFMAEGILRVAHDAYSNKVERIGTLANATNLTNESNDKSFDSYEKFQSVVKHFYPKLDESMATEMQVYTDLYNALAEVRRLALASDNTDMKNESTGYLVELKAVLEGEKVPSLDLAIDASDFLSSIVESNLEGGSEEWNVTTTPYVTQHGEHPHMAKLAKQAGNPGSYEGDWGDVAPVSDGKSYKGHSDEMRHKSWGNKGGKEVYPDLSNPYIPADKEYTMKGEPGVDKNHESGLGMYQSSDTFPNIDNPYLPKSVMPKEVK